MKLDIYAEIDLWNRNVDQLIRVLQRMAPFSIRPKQEMKAYEVRLEEIRAALNGDFTETMATRERSDQSRLTGQRTAWEEKSTAGNTTDPRLRRIGVAKRDRTLVLPQAITPAVLTASAFRRPIERVVYSQSTHCF